MTSPSSLSNTVASLVQKYNDNLLMLDALNQWAMNPTSMSAGYGIEENYVYILRNIKERYPETNWKKAMQQLRIECANLTSKYDIYECRKTIQEIIDKRNGEKLRKTI